MQIIEMLERTTDDRRHLMQIIEEHATGDAISDAMGRANRPLTRQLLSDIAGNRSDQGTVDALIGGLSDPFEGVRAAAADALGKVLAYGNERPPVEVAEKIVRALKDAWGVEVLPSVRSTLLQSLALA